MSDATATVVPETSVVVAPENAKAQPPAQASEPETDPARDPSWVKSRLERERQSLLKELGYDSVDAAKKDAEEVRNAREAKKSAAQKAAEAEAELKTTTARLEAMTKALGSHAEAEMSKLTEAQRSAVMGIAGEDPTAQLSAITALKPTWASAAAPAAPAAPEKPKDTAPAPAAPKDGGAGAPPDHKAVWEELRKTNPVFAARYAAAHNVFDK